MPAAPRSRAKQILITAGAVSACFGLLWWLREQLGIELDPRSLRPLIQDFGALGPIVFIGLASTRMLLGIPSQLILVVGGLCFGTLLGTLYGGLGLTLSALATFFAARWAGRDSVALRIPEKLRPVFEQAGSRLGALFIFIGTAYPVGFITAYNALAGITSLSVLRFTVAAGLGSLVRAGLYSYFGDSLIAGDPKLLLMASSLIAAAMVVPLLFPRSRRWISELMMR